MTHYIDGKWVEGSGKKFTSFNPATYETIWEGKCATAQEVEAACLAARKAFPAWRKLTVQQRMEALRRFASELEKIQDEFAQTLSEEVGKPFWESKSEVSAMLNKIPITIESFQERCQVWKGGDKQVLTTHHRPQGVLAVFAPFNFPGHLPNGHIAPALLCGNTVVMKCSEHTPKVGELMTKMWENADLPPGVFNMVQGEVATGEALAAHPQLDGILFTGSYTVGRKIQQHFLNDVGKILALELGGNNPLIVSNCEETKAAVHVSLLSAFFTSGQRCACARRLIVVGEQKHFIDELMKGAEAIKVGPYTASPEPFMGPVIHNDSKRQLLEAQELWLKKGAKALLPMRELDSKLPFLTSGIVDTTGIELPDEEHFGPLLKVIHVPDFAAAIKEANNTRYGLSAAVLSDKEEEFNTFFDESRAGVVNWNVPTVGASSRAPFGGVGRSGNHHPTAYYAVDYCTYPVATTTREKLAFPEKLNPGLFCTNTIK